jgi:hypothetical protein
LFLQQCFLLISFFLISGCGSSESKDESYKYRFTENGCDTGEQRFSSKQDYCGALKNDSLNNGCAATTRAKTFESAKCS